MQSERDQLEKIGFRGFTIFRKLRETGVQAIPKSAGLYIVLLPTGSVPEFLERSIGGWFKQKDPSVSIAFLKENLVPETSTIYIGKADVLQRRIRQFSDFGTGKPIAHWGGRLIWQLRDSENLIIAWKELNSGSEALQAETESLNEFISVHGRLPFANLRK
jgi:hypothetical protein